MSEVATVPAFYGRQMGGRVVVDQVTWGGTLDESSALVRAIAHNCVCEFDTNSGARTRACGPHEALTHDQRFNDGLLAYLHMRDRLLKEEGLIDGNS